MWEDPVVKDVRKAGEELAKQSKYDMDQLFKRLRENEKKSKFKIVSRTELKDARELIKA